jgi:fibronectin type 3 domain-containing protein
MKATLTWNANTEADLAGYKIYRSIGTGPMTLLASVGKVTTYVDDPLPNIDGDVGYAVTAVDTAGLESFKSATVTKAVNTVPPQAPTGLAVVIA